MGALGIFGNKGRLGSVIDHTFRFCPESLSNPWEEPCDDVKIISVGFLLLEYELPLSLIDLLTLREEIKR
jgi:hypothetical protein